MEIFTHENLLLQMEFVHASQEGILFFMIRNRCGSLRESVPRLAARLAPCGQNKRKLAAVRF